jgi:hypothetical protein
VRVDVPELTPAARLFLHIPLFFHHQHCEHVQTLAPQIFTKGPLVRTAIPRHYSSSDGAGRQHQRKQLSLTDSHAAPLTTLILPPHGVHPQGSKRLCSEQAHDQSQVRSQANGGTVNMLSGADQGRVLAAGP